MADQLPVVPQWWGWLRIQPRCSQGTLSTGKHLTSRSLLPDHLRGMPEKGPAAGCCCPPCIAGAWPGESPRTAGVRVSTQKPSLLATSLLCPLLTEINIVPASKGQIFKRPRSTFSESQHMVNLELHNTKLMGGTIPKDCVVLDKSVQVIGVWQIYSLIRGIKAGN